MTTDGSESEAQTTDACMHGACVGRTSIYAPPASLTGAASRLSPAATPWGRQTSEGTQISDLVVRVVVILGFYVTVRIVELYPVTVVVTPSKVGKKKPPAGIIYNTPPEGVLSSETVVSESSLS